MNQGEHNRFNECGRFVCLSADSGTQANPVNPVILSSTSYTYDRLGRQLSAIAAGVSTNLYAYSRYGQLTNEVVQGLCASAPLRETLSRAYDTLGRSAGFNLGDGYAVEYGYDAYGRFDSVSSAGNTYSYSYFPGSSLVSGMTASTGHAWSRSFEPQRNLISAVENTYGSAIISRFDYVNDAIGRRTSRVDSGQAFQSPAFDVYSYNTRSEVIGAQRYHGTDVSDTSKVYGGRGFGYNYDPIGNRTSASETIGGETLTKGYTANALNQYTAIANPDAVALRGVATNTATVTVNGNAASRDSVVSTWTPWHHALPTDNANGPDYTFANIMAVVNPPGTNTPDLVSTASGSVYAPPQAEVLAYDDDGNLLSDGRFNYTWNGENRLVKAEEQVCPTNRTLRKVEYAYDHQGRMVWKVVSRRGAEAQSWEDEKATSYLWDRLNIIAETMVTGSATNTTYNIWGLDLDGTLQGAGGVGGLLAVVKDSATYVPAWDANGNILEYIAEDGTIVAHREYDPFGGTVVATGDTDAFTHWFSTKPWCAATGLSEYQYRKYSPVMGRWLSRDPMEENGGVNLYGFCFNNSIWGVDNNGLIVMIVFNTAYLGSKALPELASSKVEVNGASAVINFWGQFVDESTYLYEYLLKGRLEREWVFLYENEDTWDRVAYLECVCIIDGDGKRRAKIREKVSDTTMNNSGFDLRVPLKIVNNVSVGLTFTDAIHSELFSIPEASGSGEQDVRSYYVDADWNRKVGGAASVFGISAGIFTSETTRASMRTPTIRLECDVSSGKPIMRGSGQGEKRFNERAPGGRMPHGDSGGGIT